MQNSRGCFQVMYLKSMLFSLHQTNVFCTHGEKRVRSGRGCFPTPHFAPWLVELFVSPLLPRWDMGFGGKAHLKITAQKLGAKHHSPKGSAKGLVGEEQVDKWRKEAVVLTSVPRRQVGITLKAENLESIVLIAKTMPTELHHNKRKPSPSKHCQERCLVKQIPSF